ncbi:MAG: hypothetical protein ACI4NI_01205 [Candidatus Ornithospirochaeta sp.]
MVFEKQIKERIRTLKYAFYPKNTLILCSFFLLLIIVLLGIVMYYFPKNSNWYSIAFALITGASSSFFVSLVVELSSNYRHNKLAWYELEDYYKELLEYEYEKNSLMGKDILQLMIMGDLGDFLSQDDEDGENIEEVKDNIQVVWELLPRLVPVLKKTYKSKKEYLTETELDNIRTILERLDSIKTVVRRHVSLCTLENNIQNLTYETTLKYPQRIIKNMPLWLRKEFADRENYNAVDLYIDEILSDYYIFNKFMKDYDVSMKSLNIPNSEINRLRNKYYDEFLDNEETPKYNDIVYQRKVSEKERMLYNKELSCFCNDIYECLEILLKELKKKPYFGDKLDFYKKIINTHQSL